MRDEQPAPADAPSATESAQGVPEACRGCGGRGWKWRTARRSLLLHPAPSAPRPETVRVSCRACGGASVTRAA